MKSMIVKRNCTTCEYILRLHTEYPCNKCLPSIVLKEGYIFWKLKKVSGKEF